MLLPVLAPQYKPFAGSAAAASAARNANLY
jgi:hypothetical protein